MLMSAYQFAAENIEASFPELEPLYRRHYGEMQARMAEQGVTIGDFAPRLKPYFDAGNAGWLLTYVVRFDGAPIGYSNIYVTDDMHNGEKIASEDTIYILPEHRNGVGRRLVKHILEDLRSRGVKRVTVTAKTDLRVSKVWQRMGFRHTADELTFVF